MLEIYIKSYQKTLVKPQKNFTITPGRESLKFDIFKCLHLVYLNSPRILMTHDKMAVVVNKGA